MKLIADSGSTKTSWCLFRNDGSRQLLSTQGINPFQQSEEVITQVLLSELLPQLYTSSTGSDTSDAARYPLSINFYGAGCTAEQSPRVQSALRNAFPSASAIEVQSDMLGAARSLCGHRPGIVAILGTGSNSCLYDGTRIVRNVSPLGFILGDEGSGAYIGRRLVGDVLKQQLPTDICQAFLSETNLTAPEIIRRTYREPMPNRFLASLSPFCARHRDNPAIRSLLIDCFSQFFQRNITAYDGTVVHLVGSVAYYYQEEIKSAAALLGYIIGNVLREPLEGLIAYHS